MTESYLKNITPDSLSGLIFGFEGIKNALVILNGPTGCKFYHSITAETQSVHKDDYDPLNYPDEWFFGQRRVPCTYLDKRDYVYGSEGKLTDAIKYILRRLAPDILAVINSPGAALIGDDLERIVNEALKEASNEAPKEAANEALKEAANEAPNEAADPDGKPYARLPVITCQSPGYSKDIKDGWKAACRTAIDKLCGDRYLGPADFCSRQADPDEAEIKTPSVNLLGLSIYQKYHAGDIAEIKRLFGLCGISVNTALLCESSLSEIRQVPEASLNVVIDPDWGLDSAEYLKERFGTPFVVSEYGYPVGFKAMKKLIRSVTEAVNEMTGCDHEAMSADPEPALTELEKARSDVYLPLARMSSLTGLPKGAHFAVYGNDAVKRGYSTFLTEYLGMTEDEDDPEVVLADGNTIAMMKAEGKKICGIEISLPSIGYIDVIQKTHLGAEGGKFLIEQILNSFVY